MLCHSERSEESVSVCIIELCLHKQILHFVQNDRDRRYFDTPAQNAW